MANEYFPPDSSAPQWDDPDRQEAAAALDGQSPQGAPSFYDESMARIDAERDLRAMQAGLPHGADWDAIIVAESPEAMQLLAAEGNDDPSMAEIMAARRRISADSADYQRRLMELRIGLRTEEEKRAELLKAYGLPADATDEDLARGESEYRKRIIQEGEDYPQLFGF